MEKISSFTINHLTLNEGIYISRIDGDVVTYDLRFCRPYSGYVLSNEQLHTIEHLLATILRNDLNFGRNIVYFGPMGCQTGFYLLVNMKIGDTITHSDTINMILKALEKAMNWNEEIPGNSKIECGNCDTLDLASAKEAIKKYYDTLSEIKDLKNMKYPQ